LFHHTDVRNAARALNAGRLLSRSRAEALHALEVDSASPGVIGQTASWVKGYARLYFRPRTPTQWHQEGIRPKAHIYDSTAHCPVPIFFLFSSIDVVTLEKARFSNGNLGVSGVEWGDGAEFLSSLDFQKIYSTGPHEQGDRSITFSRNAEVAVKDELGLSALRAIVARTPAERDTLISLLDAPALRKWNNHITVDAGLDLFERKYNFVEKVDLTDNGAMVHFSPDSCAPGPFKVGVFVTDLGTNHRIRHVEDGFDCPAHWIIDLPRSMSAYRLTINLDNHLAFRTDYFSALPW
jgi:hypothetical protein